MGTLFSESQLGVAVAPASDATTGGLKLRHVQLPSQGRMVYMAKWALWVSWVAEAVACMPIACSK